MKYDRFPEAIVLCNYIIVFFNMVYIHNETMKLHLGLLNIVYQWLHMIQILWDSRAQSLENVMILSITLAGCCLRKNLFSPVFATLKWNELDLSNCVEKSLLRWG